MTLLTQAEVEAAVAAGVRKAIDGIADEAMKIFAGWGLFFGAIWLIREAYRYLAKG